MRAKGDIEFFRDDLSERCADTCAEIDMTVERADRSVGVDPDESLETRLSRR
jgi:hypothetical protein